MYRYDPDSEFNNDEDPEEMEEEEYSALLEKQHDLEVIQIDLVIKDLNKKILNKAIQTLEKSWFWKFRSTKYKIAAIEETYRSFKDLID